jgi:Family of unknown function (DUF5367)
MKRALALGVLLWLVATAILRLAPAGLLDPSRTVEILVCYAASFGLIFLVIRAFVARPEGGAAALRAGVALFLPTLVFDALASALFPAVYPNFSPASAGVFGGWMLICCGGGLAGLVSRPAVVMPVRPAQ